jgi:hypothetical protein
MMCHRVSVGLIMVEYDLRVIDRLVAKVWDGKVVGALNWFRSNLLKRVVQFRTIVSIK